MSVSVEKLENSMAKLTIEVSAEDFTKAVDKVYNRQKNRINVPGFRKGKAPKVLIEKMYGAGVFYEDAANDSINASYPQAVKDCGEEVVSDPEIGITQIEEGKPFIYTATVALRPEVTLGQYKGVEITKQDPVEVTEDEINAELKRQQDANAKIENVTNRPVKDGDEIVLDFSGSVDGEKFEGGTAQDYDLVIGSGSFIPGFEDQLIGAEIGKEKDVHVTFPEDYGQKDLAGKAAVFECTVKSIKEKILPELNDQFADDVSEFSTLAEYKEDVKKNIADRKEKANRTDKENETVDAVIANAKIDIPEAMLKTQQRQIANEFAQQLQMQGLQFEQYLQYTGMTRDQFIEQMKPQADKRIRTRLCLEEIVKAENITVSDDEYNAELQKMADQYKIPVENVKKVYSEQNAEDDLKKDIAVQKAITLITDAALETKEKKTAEADEAEADTKSAKEKPEAEEQKADDAQ